MSHDKPREKVRWHPAVVDILLMIYFLWLAGLFLVSAIRDAYGGQPLFNHDWGLLLIGIWILAGESVLASRKESSSGAGKNNLSVTMGLIAIGLMIVAPDIVLKAHFGALALLAVVTVAIVWFNGINKNPS